MGGVTRLPVLGYDALGRLWTVTGAVEATRLLWDGDSLAGEFDTGSGSFTQQVLHGASGDEPLVLFGGSAQYPVSDERGSVVATADGTGAGWRAQSYGPYGETGSGGVTVGRFGYAGQAWLPDAQVYHMRARAYAPGLGRFLQSDPIGYEGGINQYGYVGGDPVNYVDPSELDYVCTGTITFVPGDPYTGSGPNEIPTAGGRYKYTYDCRETGTLPKAPPKAGNGPPPEVVSSVPITSRGTSSGGSGQIAPPKPPEYRPVPGSLPGTMVMDRNGKVHMTDRGRRQACEGYARFQRSNA